MISYYVIPEKVHYVQFIDQIEKWTKTDKPRPNIPTVAVINDSKASRYIEFVVIYKGMMQRKGGSGACYNPTIPTFIYGKNPMDNTIMEPHMAKWEVYSYTKLLQIVVKVKYDLLKKIGIETGRWGGRDESTTLPNWFWEMEGYEDNVGLLIGKLDLIGLRRANCSIIQSKDYRTCPKLLTS